MIPEDEPSEKLYNKEEIKMKLEKIDVLEKEINYLKTEINIIHKRIGKIYTLLEEKKWL